MATAPRINSVEHYLGKTMDALLGFSNPRIPKERLQLPGPDFVDRVFAQSNRSARVAVSRRSRLVASWRETPQKSTTLFGGSLRLIHCREPEVGTAYPFFS